MGSYCASCGEWMNYRTHRCKQKWHVTEYLNDGKLDFERSGTLVYADDAEEAAENYSRTSDEGGDYTIIGNGGCDKLYVRAVEGGEVTVWSIQAEAEPKYYAHQIQETPPEVVGDEEDYYCTDCLAPKGSDGCICGRCPDCGIPVEHPCQCVVSQQFAKANRPPKPWNLAQTERN